MHLESITRHVATMYKMHENQNDNDIETTFFGSGIKVLSFPPYVHIFSRCSVQSCVRSGVHITMTYSFQTTKTSVRKICQ